MDTNEKIVRLKLRKDSKDAWSEHNPVLLDGEMGITEDNKIKIGDGISSWNELAYVSNPFRSGTGQGAIEYGKYAEANGDLSFAIGYRGEKDDGEIVAPQANGEISFNHGIGNTTEAVNSAVFGMLNAVGDKDDTNVGNSSFTTGRENTVKGSQTLTGGYKNENLGYYGTVVGTLNKGGTDDEDYINEIPSAGTSVFVTGYKNTALGEGSVAANAENTTHGRASAAFGHANTTYGYASVALGEDNVVGNSDIEYDHYGLYPTKNKAAVAIGKGLSVDGDGEVAVGKYNQPAEELFDKVGAEFVDSTFLIGTSVSDAKRKTSMAAGRTRKRYYASGSTLSHGTNLIVIPFKLNTLPLGIKINSDIVRIFLYNEWMQTSETINGYEYITATINEIWNGNFSGGVSDAIRINATTAKYDDGSSATDYINEKFAAGSNMDDYAFEFPTPIVVCDNLKTEELESDTANIGTLKTTNITSPRESIYGTDNSIGITAPNGVYLYSYNGVTIDSDSGRTNNKVCGLQDPSDDHDAATKKYVDDTALSMQETIRDSVSASIDSSLQNYVPQFAYGNMSIGSSSSLTLNADTGVVISTPYFASSGIYNQIKGLADPTDERDAVPKKYVDEKYSYIKENNTDYSRSIHISVPTTDGNSSASLILEEQDDGHYSTGSLNIASGNFFIRGGYQLDLQAIHNMSLISNKITLKDCSENVFFSADYSGTEIKNLIEPTEDSDAATKKYVDEVASSFNNYSYITQGENELKLVVPYPSEGTASLTLDGTSNNGSIDLSASSGNVSLHGYGVSLVGHYNVSLSTNSDYGSIKIGCGYDDPTSRVVQINNLVAPVNKYDAATKEYVDATHGALSTCCCDAYIFSELTYTSTDGQHNNGGVYLLTPTCYRDFTDYSPGNTWDNLSGPSTANTCTISGNTIIYDIQLGSLSYFNGYTKWQDFNSGGDYSGTAGISSGLVLPIPSCFVNCNYTPTTYTSSFYTSIPGDPAAGQDSFSPSLQTSSKVVVLPDNYFYIGSFYPQNFFSSSPQRIQFKVEVILDPATVAYGNYSFVDSNMFS